MKAKKLIKLILVFTVLAGSFFSCENKMNEDRQEVDGVTFDNLASAPKKIVSKENLPKWLNAKINELDPPPVFPKIQVFQGEWKKRTVYFIMHPYFSCVYCEIYTKDGERIVDDNLSDLLVTSKNWILIYECGGE